MNNVLSRPPDYLVPALPAFDASSRGMTEGGRVAEHRIRSMQRLTSGTVADIGKNAIDTRARQTLTIDQQLAAKSAALKKLLSAVSMYLDAGWRVQLLERLDVFLDAGDWNNDLALPSEESFATFLRAIIYLHPSKHPGLGLSARGNFLASWRRDRNRIVIEFQSKDQLRWVLSQTLDGVVESGAGVNPTHRLPDVIAGYEPERLFHNDERLLA